MVLRFVLSAASRLAPDSRYLTRRSGLLRQFAGSLQLLRFSPRYAVIVIDTIVDLTF